MFQLLVYINNRYQKHPACKQQSTKKKGIAYHQLKLFDENPDKEPDLTDEAETKAKRQNR